MTSEPWPRSRGMLQCPRAERPVTNTAASEKYSREALYCQAVPGLAGLDQHNGRGVGSVAPTPPRFAQREPVPEPASAYVDSAHPEALHELLQDDRPRRDDVR